MRMRLIDFSFCAYFGQYFFMLWSYAPLQTPCAVLQNFWQSIPSRSVIWSLLFLDPLYQLSFDICNNHRRFLIRFFLSLPYRLAYLVYCYPRQVVYFGFDISRHFLHTFCEVKAFLSILAALKLIKGIQLSCFSLFKALIQTRVKF